jgi:hypothetical protein
MVFAAPQVLFRAWKRKERKHYISEADNNFS